MSSSRIAAVDLCGGAGGWACAARGLPIDILLAVDLWDVACRTYKLNHPDTAIICGDVRDEEVRKQIASLCDCYGVSCILGAIPCEWLTHRRMCTHNPVTDEERERERATLRSVLTLIEQISPAYWCLEDVKGLRAELSPDVPWLVIDSADFSAQRRQRLYVGHFPAPILNANGHVLRDLARPGPYRIGRRSADREIAWSQHFTPKHVRGVRLGKKAPTVCAASSRRDADHVVIDPKIAGGRRQLEWQEGAALQGFPEDYVFYGCPTDVWKMVGQAIQIDTGRAILEQIVKDAKAQGSESLPARKQASPCAGIGGRAEDASR